MRVCLNRAAALVGDVSGLTLIEPSAGDGAFLRGLSGHPIARQISHVTAVELLPEEAAKCRGELEALHLAGEVIEGSFLDWVVGRGGYAIAVGNPPFVRYQFVAPGDQRAIPAVAQHVGVSLAGVSNLWIPVLLGSLASLRDGGAFAFIVPSECFTGISARAVRSWLTANADDLRVDLFPGGSFPNVLQEVVVLSGRRVKRSDVTRSLEVKEHLSDGRSLTWVSPLDDHPTWTRILLEPEHVEALEAATGIPAVARLGQVARFEVAAVTGANDYFCVDRDTVDAYALADWAVPLLPRIRHAPGLIYTRADQEATAAAGAKSFLLNFSDDRPVPTASMGPGLYLGLATAAKIDRRYKTRIRDPWYRVPHIRSGRLMMSKRSHRFPRVVLNQADVVTTDTIYRGSMRSGFEGRERDLVASFHNSLTLLSAEVEGRSFGGGVLELVPSEISRLSVPLPVGFGQHLAMLDASARSVDLAQDGEDIVDVTDSLLIRSRVGLNRDLLFTLREARLALARRRFDRN